MRCVHSEGMLVQAYMVLQVMGLEFNALSPHLLASAGLDGQLAIWDLTDPQKPKQYAPMKARPLPWPCSGTVRSLYLVMLPSA